MGVRVSLAAVFADRIGGENEVEVEGRTAGEVLRALTDLHPPLRVLVWTPRGEFNAMLAAFLNGENLRSLKGLDTPVKPGDELMLISALEGG